MVEIMNQSIMAPQAQGSNESRPMGAVKKGNNPKDLEFAGALSQAGVVIEAIAPKLNGETKSPDDSDLQTAVNEKGIVADSQGASVISGLSINSPAVKTQSAGVQALAPQGTKTEQTMALRGPSASSVERAPATQLSAASLNTGVALAGLKPWSKEWVFEKAMAKDQQTLADVLNPAPEAALNAQALDAGNLRSLRGEAQAAPIVNPGVVAAAGKALSAVAPSNAQFMAQLSELKGEIEQVAEGGVESGKMSTVRNPVSGLSGSEFMDTLSGVRVEPQHQGQGQFQGQSQFQDRGQPQMNLGRQPGQVEPRLELKGRELKAINGGKNVGEVLKTSSSSLAKPRLIRAGNEEWLSGLDARAGAGVIRHAASQGSGAMPKVELTGHVIPGSMARERLASASLQGISTEIRNLTASGGGEIRVHLKPESLGELHVRVVTNGSNVGLHIQASDENAKRVLEESLTHLKDSLASQNLSLTKVDLTIAQVSGKSSGMGDSADQQNSQFQQQHSFQDSSLMGQSAWQRNEGRGSWAGESQDFGSGRAVAGSRMGSVASTMGVAANIRNANRQANGRLDVMA